MESDILKLDSVLSLSVEEASGPVIPLSEWNKGLDGYDLTLIGRLLSHRSVPFEALKGTLIQLIQAARGVTMRKISEERFCLVFNHIEDIRRVLVMRPWIFYRNLVVLQPLSLSDDPLSISLDWCPFFVHIHDLNCGQRSVAVVRHIGKAVGSWLDVENVEKDISWFEHVRIRLNINVSASLKRALRIQSAAGESSIVRFSYERLPNFCYLCGKLGHISRFCDLRFQENFSDPGPNTPFGAWLCASGPLKRFGAVSKSVRPTYVWNTRCSDGRSGSRPRGAQIFGSFQGHPGDAAAVEPGASSATVRRTVTTEPLLHKQLAMEFGTKGGLRFRHLRDESSNSLDLSNRPTPVIGPKSVEPGTAINLGPALSKPSLDLSVAEAHGMDPLSPCPFELAQPQFGVVHQPHLSGINLPKSLSSPLRSSTNSPAISHNSGDSSFPGIASSFYPVVSSSPSSPALVDIPLLDHCPSFSLIEDGGG
ncbi:hypothetical protein Salat_1883000 [Sesamum alatum]|uniref:CCHC-type domain-containing protein n=1 Tax=Sesamum alatum TaxID=300844 RepID=A0AAE2CIA0_9LAMI|nr:hypothetical protein Salat_1883000 [Sesamum alatum]